MFPELPFEITEHTTSGYKQASNNRVVITTEVPCVMMRRRSRQPGMLTPSEMVYAALPDSTIIYFRQFASGHVKVAITKRQLYDIGQYHNGDMVTLTAEVPCSVTRSRNGIIDASLQDGTHMNVRQYPTGHVDIIVTKRDI